MRVLRILLLLMVAAGLFRLTVRAPVDYTGYDTRGALLVSQALLETGKVRLDPYLERGFGLGYRAVEKDGHQYYFFPVGSSLLALPFVAAARLGGMDMNDPVDDARLQRWLGALSVSVLFLLLVLTLRQRLPGESALALALGTVLGSTLSSTLGTAFWSLGPSLICLLGALWLYLRSRRLERRLLVWPFGLLLFLAYLCRPTAALPLVLLGLLALFQYSVQRRRLVLAIVFPFLLLAAWSLGEFGSLLPDYYLPSRVGSTHLGQGLWGTLFSPSRGLFVFSPQLLLAVLVFLRLRSSRVDRSLVLLSLLWFLGQWWAASSFPHWWGGHSYGPRLMTEAVLPLVLLGAEALRSFEPERWPVRQRALGVSGLLVVSVPGAFLHVETGLYEPATQEWNRYPDVDHHPERLLDWSDPQFLATSSKVEQARRKLELERLQTLPLGATATPAEPWLLWESWYAAEATRAGELYRWSEGTEARVLFALQAPTELVPDLELVVRIGAFESQEVGLFLNDRTLGSLEHTGFAPADYRFDLRADQLWWQQASERPDPAMLNELRLEIPHAGGSDAGRERRILGLALWALRLETP